MKINIYNNTYKIVLVSCAVSLVFGYIYSFVPFNPVNTISLGLIIVSAIIVVWQALAVIWNSKEIFRKRPYTYVEFPEFRRLADNMGIELNKKILSKRSKA